MAAQQHRLPEACERRTRPAARRGRGVEGEVGRRQGPPRLPDGRDRPHRPVSRAVLLCRSQEGDAHARSGGGGAAGALHLHRRAHLAPVGELRQGRRMPHDGRRTDAGRAGRLDRVLSARRRGADGARSQTSADVLPLASGHGARDAAVHPRLRAQGSEHARRLGRRHAARHGVHEALRPAGRKGPQLLHDRLQRVHLHGRRLARRLQVERPQDDGQPVRAAAS